MKELNLINLSIHPITKTLEIEQQGNKVSLTRDQLNCLKKLKEGKYEDNAFTSSMSPYNRFKMDDNGDITITCKDDYRSDEITLTKNKKYNPMKIIESYVNKKKHIISWDKDFKKRSK